jgi:hypothetical protein
MGGRSGQSLTRSGQQAARSQQPESGNDYPDARIVESGTNTSRFSTNDLIAMSGVPKDFRGRITVSHYRGESFIDVDDEGLRMRRRVRSEVGIVQNRLFKIADDSRFKGRGYKIFESQVNELRKKKFEKITVYAAGNINNPDYNGYYTWARFGYQPKKEDATQIVEMVNRTNGTQFKSWYEMMNTVTGQKLWKQIGSDWDGEFDLKSNSLSMKTWKNYLKYRKSQSE